MLKSAAAGAISVLVALLGCGCGGDARGKVLLVGLDGLEWSLVRPMAEAGELPNLARLMANGAHGKLRSLVPPAPSPAIWATIATSRNPHEHRVESFNAGERNESQIGATRAVEAIWNIASAKGRTVGVVGWLVSWPAEEVNGFMVSDKLRGAERTDGETHPPQLAAEVAPLLVDSEAQPWSYVQRFLDTPLPPGEPDPELRVLLGQLRRIAAADEGTARIAEQLYRERRPELFAVYLRGTDLVGHRFWNYMRPGTARPEQLRPEGFPFLKGAVRAYYRYADELVGRLLAHADARTTVIVVSDHGFQGGPGGVLTQHTLDGVLIVSGWRAGRGEVTGATVYDVTPTMLALLGIPPAKDMRGKVLWSALDPAVQKEELGPAPATYETGARAARPATPPPARPVDRQELDQLKALGYVQ